MPLSPENQKLVEQRRLAEPTWSNWDQHPAALDRLLNACRLEERAKAEGEVEKRAPVQGFTPGIPWSMHLRAYDAYRAKWGEQKALIDLEGRNCRGGFGTKELDMFIPGWRDELSELTALKSNLAKAEARIAELTQEGEETHKFLDLIGQARTEGEGPGEDVLTLKGRIINLEADRLTSELRATQAEEVVGPPYVFRRFYDGEERAEGVQINLATTLEEATLKAVRLCRERGTTVLVLKAAPLQGEGSSSASGVESAARLASQVCDPTAPSSTGGGEA